MQGKRKKKEGERTNRLKETSETFQSNAMLGPCLDSNLKKKLLSKLDGHIWIVAEHLLALRKLR